jgi:hypothetical protein
VTIRKQRLMSLFAAILAGSAIMVVGRWSSEAGSVAPILQAPAPGADAQQLWKYISKDNPYKSWKNFPGQSGRYVHVNENPHGDWIAVYLNPEAEQSLAYPSKPFQMKYGSIIVKENYSLLKGDPINQPPLTAVPVGLTTLTVMYKVKGYQRVPKEEEWFWVMYSCYNGECDGSVVTISNQPFVKELIPQSKDTFEFFQGEVMAGKPWLCLECHQRANISNNFSFGDYMWKVKAFAPK